jgi:hypothetical protein
MGAAGWEAFFCFSPASKPEAWVATGRGEGEGGGSRLVASRLQCTAVPTPPPPLLPGTNRIVSFFPQFSDDPRLFLHVASRGPEP